MSEPARFTAVIREPGPEADELLRLDLASWDLTGGVAVLRPASTMFNGDREVGIRLDPDWPMVTADGGLMARIGERAPSCAGCLLVVEQVSGEGSSHEGRSPTAAGLPASSSR